MVLVASLVFRAPSGRVAREIATRELRSEWSISKPARALQTLRRPPHQWHQVADVWRVDSLSVQALPPPTSTAARPAGPSGALHTGGAVSLMCGALARNPARLSSPQSGPAFASQASCPALAHIAAESTPNFARNSPATISNIEFRSLELQRFRTLLKLRSIELRARF